MQKVKSNQAVVDKRLKAWIARKGPSTYVIHFSEHGLWVADGTAMLKVESHHVPSDALPESGKVTKHTGFGRC